MKQFLSDPRGQSRITQNSKCDFVCDLILVSNLENNSCEDVDFSFIEISHHELVVLNNLRLCLAECSKRIVVASAQSYKLFNQMIVQLYWCPTMIDPWILVEHRRHFFRVVLGSEKRVLFAFNWGSEFAFLAFRFPGNCCNFKHFSKLCVAEVLCWVNSVYVIVECQSLVFEQVSSLSQTSIKWCRLWVSRK